MYVSRLSAEGSGGQKVAQASVQALRGAYVRSAPVATLLSSIVPSRSEWPLFFSIVSRVGFA